MKMFQYWASVARDLALSLTLGGVSSYDNHFCIVTMKWMVAASSYSVRIDLNYRLSSCYTSYYFGGGGSYEDDDREMSL